MTLSIKRTIQRILAANKEILYGEEAFYFVVDIGFDYRNVLDAQKIKESFHESMDFWVNIKEYDMFEDMYSAAMLHEELVDGDLDRLKQELISDFDPYIGKGKSIPFLGLGDTLDLAIESLDKDVPFHRLFIGVYHWDYEEPDCGLFHVFSALEELQAILNTTPTNHEH